MKILVIGSGGREHALAKKFMESPQAVSYTHLDVYKRQGNCLKNKFILKRHVQVSFYFYLNCNNFSNEFMYFFN